MSPLLGTSRPSAIPPEAASPPEPAMSAEVSGRSELPVPSVLSVAPELAELAGRVQAALRTDRPDEPDAELVELRPLTGGASGLTLLGRVRGGTGGSGSGDRRVVVKTIPAGLRPTRNRDLARQVRLLRYLAERSPVPVPEVLAFDPGSSGEGEGGAPTPPLFVMSHVEGQSFDPTNPDGSTAPPPATTAARARAAVRALAALQRVDVAGLAEAPTSLTDELNRWERAFATTTGAHRAPADDLIAALRAALPAPVQPVLTHGDYRLGNLLFREAELIAVLDWEIWSIADPRLDLAWFVARAIAGHPSHPDDALGLPGAGELLECYGGRPPAFAWFLALAAVKHAAASALIDKRSPVGRDPERVGRLLTWAARQLESDETEIGNG